MTSKAKISLDEKDWHILRALQENARLSFVEIGKHVGLTSAAVGQRVKRMEEQGFILAYRAIVNPGKLGLPMTVFIRATLPLKDTLDFREAAKQCQEVIECHRVTGTETYILKAIVSSPAHLAQLLEKLPPADFVSSIVLNSPVEWRTIDQNTSE